MSKSISKQIRIAKTIIVILMLIILTSTIIHCVTINNMLLEVGIPVFKFIGKSIVDFFVFEAMGIVAIIVLRRKEKELDRSIKRNF